MTTRTIATPNVTFEAFDEGKGPLVLCLHGFPDQAHSFRHQIPALVEAGYRVVRRTCAASADDPPLTAASTPCARRGHRLVGFALLPACRRLGHDWPFATYFGALLPRPHAEIVTAAYRAAHRSPVIHDEPGAIRLLVLFFPVSAPEMASHATSRWRAPGGECRRGGMARR